MPQITSRSVANVGTTAAAAGLRAGEGLITVAYLLKVLGAESFGLWALISTTTAYFLILDVGVLGSLGRLLAGHRGKGDIEGFNRTASTATTLLAATGILTIFVAFGIADLFPRVFHVPEAQLADVRTALLIVGFGVALYFPTSVFNVVLWSYERFDLINLVEMPVIIIRLALILWLIHEGSSLTELALVGFATTLMITVLTAILAWRVEPRLRPVPWRISRPVLTDIYSVGVWFSALSIGKALTLQVGPTLVGTALGNRAVATFSIARQLTTYTGTVMLSLTQIAAPRAAVLYFGQQGDEQKALFVTGGRVATALALFFVGGFLTLGAAFITVWQGGRQDEAFLPLVILMLGELFPMAQGVTYSILTAMGRHQRLAQFAWAELAVSIVLGAFAIWVFGLIGVCAAVALASCVFRGLCPWILACRLLATSPAAYLREAVLPVTAVWSVGAAITVTLASAYPPDGWLQLIEYALLYAALTVPACTLVVLGRDVRVWLKEAVARRAQLT